MNPIGGGAYQLRQLCIAAILLGGLPFSAGALPDLVINAARAKATVEYRREAFTTDSCAYQEACIRTVGNRKLLLLDVAIKNVGASDLEIGDPATHPDLRWSDCHGHYHLNGLATYRVLTRNGRQMARTYKQGFCLRDDEPNSSNVASPARYTCEYQGISAGWQDVYEKSLDCQWVDITGVPAGVYNLEIRINTRRVLRESNYSNNKVVLRIRIPRNVPR
jgi:hypothetical protein